MIWRPPRERYFKKGGKFSKILQIQGWIIFSLLPGFHKYHCGLEDMGRGIQNGGPGHPVIYKQSGIKLFLV